MEDESGSLCWKELRVSALCGQDLGWWQDSQVGGAQAEHGAVRDNGSGATPHHVISFHLLLSFCLAFQVHVTTYKHKATKLGVQLINSHHAGHP